MDIRTLESLIVGIDRAMEYGEARAAGFYGSLQDTNLSVSEKLTKVREFGEITGHLLGNLAYTRHVLQTELDKKKQKKFYQFWK